MSKESIKRQRENISSEDDAFEPKSLRETFGFGKGPKKPKLDESKSKSPEEQENNIYDKDDFSNWIDQENTDNKNEPDNVRNLKNQLVKNFPIIKPKSDDIWNASDLIKEWRESKNKETYLYDCFKTRKFVNLKLDCKYKEDTIPADLGVSRRPVTLQYLVVNYAKYKEKTLPKNPFKKDYEIKDIKVNIKKNKSPQKKLNLVSFYKNSVHEQYRYSSEKSYHGEYSIFLNLETGQVLGPYNNKAIYFLNFKTNTFINSIDKDKIERFVEGPEKIYPDDHDYLFEGETGNPFSPPGNTPDDSDDSFNAINTHYAELNLKDEFTLRAFYDAEKIGECLGDIYKQYKDKNKKISIIPLWPPNDTTFLNKILKEKISGESYTTTNTNTPIYEPDFLIQKDSQDDDSEENRVYTQKMGAEEEDDEEKEVNQDILRKKNKGSSSSDEKGYSEQLEELYEEGAINGLKKMHEKLISSLYISETEYNSNPYHIPRKGVFMIKTKYGDVIDLVDYISHTNDIIENEYLFTKQVRLQQMKQSVEEYKHFLTLRNDFISNGRIKSNKLILVESEVIDSPTKPVPGEEIKFQNNYFEFDEFIHEQTPEIKIYNDKESHILNNEFIQKMYGVYQNQEDVITQYLSGFDYSYEFGTRSFKKDPYSFKKITNGGIPRYSIYYNLDKNVKDRVVIIFCDSVYSVKDGVVPQKKLIPPSLFSRYDKNDPATKIYCDNIDKYRNLKAENRKIPKRFILLYSSDISKQKNITDRIME
jgi:hypothetical protein